MAFDGIITAAMAAEIRETIVQGKIDRVHQPEPEELVLGIHTKNGNRRLYCTVNNAGACIRFLDQAPANPPQPLSFCMLLRKHLIGGRIVSVEQKDCERIIEIAMETRNELGFTVSKKLIFELMGKYNNIILVNLENGKIIDAIRRVPIDTGRSRAILPGALYEYPTAQDKVPFRDATPEDLDQAGETWKSILSKIGGISPAIARQLLLESDRRGFLDRIEGEIGELDFVPRVYLDDQNTPREFHITPLTEYEESCRVLTFDTLSDALGFFYEHRQQSNRARQKANDVMRAVTKALNRSLLKDQRLKEDLLAAENSDDLRLYGELLMANLHQLKSGMSSARVTNYYNGTEVTIPLEPRFSPNKNAQQYFKRYGKAKTAVKEKQIQIEENQRNISYLESVMTYLENAQDVREIEELREELEETSVLRKRKSGQRAPKKKYRAQPHEYRTSDGFTVLVGRNNKENDVLTLQIAAKTDYWLHTKDIPGSHVIVRTEGQEITETAIFEAAAIAAFYSKARSSGNVPVDYVKVRHVKKPSGAKPGMVIFTNNRTVYVDPKDPEAESPDAPGAGR